MLAKLQKSFNGLLRNIFRAPAICTCICILVSNKRLLQKKREGSSDIHMSAYVRQMCDL